MNDRSEIASWLADKSVFITGGTGFLGKVLIEKLLYSCPDLDRIYVLMRPKREVEPRERLQKILASSIFNRGRNEQRDLAGKLQIVSGDLSQPDLGMTREDRQLLLECISVVFHVAATVRFNDFLRVSMAINVNGTRAMLELCREMKRLESVVYVSTAYSNCNKSIIEEKIYPPPMDIDKLNQLASNLDDDELEYLVPRLRKDWPNTYTYTKAIAESVVAKYACQLPVTIVRPSIVSGCWKEPYPGWVDSANGIAGLEAAALKGFLKTMYCNPNCVVDLIPVDACINMIIAAAWSTGQSREFGPDVVVYNCTSGPFAPCTWKQFMDYGNEQVRRIPSSTFFMIPYVNVNSNRQKHIIMKTALEHAPALIADIFVYLIGGKPRCRKILAKVHSAVDVYRYFMANEWKFRARNVELLRNKLSSIDKQTFDFDIRNLNWEDYCRNNILEIRSNILKESPDTIPHARRKVAIMRVVLKVIKIMILAIFIFYLFQKFTRT